MEIILIKDKEAWDRRLLQSSSRPSFLQSWEWGEILRAEGKEVERLAIFEGNETVAQALVVYQQMPLGLKYAMAPKGPVIRSTEIQKNGNTEISEVHKNIYRALIDYFAQEHVIFFRCEPLFLYFGISLFQKVIDVTPRTTAILDLGKSEDELFAGMHKKTRYSIRIASAQQLAVSDQKDYKILWELLGQTARRDGFRLHPEEHYRLVVESPFSFQLTAYHSDIPIATAVFIGFSKIFTYLFAASDYQYHDFSASYLIQWEAIKLAKRRGYQYYDFFGIAPREETNKKKQGTNISEYDYDRKHPYAGITKFKIGFGGEVAESPGTFDLVIEPSKYRIYKLLRAIRRFF